MNTRESRENRGDAEWRASLTDDQYRVLREHGTERPGSSPLNAEKRPGVFTCRLCGLPLFKSGSKFESGTGWPSFFSPFDPEHVREIRDTNYGMVRTGRFLMVAPSSTVTL